MFPFMIISGGPYWRPGEGPGEEGYKSPKTPNPDTTVDNATAATKRRLTRKERGWPCPPPAPKNRQS